MLRIFKTEIRLTKKQCIKINQTIGNCRFIYNYFISYNKELYETFLRKFPLGNICACTF